MNKFGQILFYPQQGEGSFRTYIKTSAVECLADFFHYLLIHTVKTTKHKPHFVVAADCAPYLVNQLRKSMAADLCTVTTVDLRADTLVNISLIKTYKHTMAIFINYLSPAGAINNVLEISKLAKEYNILLACNISGFFPQHEINILALGIDLYTFETATEMGQQICVMGIREGHINSYSMHDYGAPPSISKSLVKMALKNMKQYNAEDIHKLNLFKRGFMKFIAPAAASDGGPLETPPDILLFNSKKEPIAKCLTRFADNDLMRLNISVDIEKKTITDIIKEYGKATE